MADPTELDGDEERVRYRGTDRLGGDLVVTDRRILVGEGAERVVPTTRTGEGVAHGDDGDAGSVAGESEGEGGGVASGGEAMDVVSGGGEDDDVAGDDESDGDEEVVSIPLESVSELTKQSIDWFLLLMDIAIVAFGLFSLARTLLGGVGFLLAGVVSLALTWRRRGRVRVRTHARPKPMDTYPASPAAFLGAVDDALTPIRERRPPAERGADGPDP